MNFLLDPILPTFWQGTPCLFSPPFTHSLPTHLLIPFSLHQTCKLHALSHPLYLCPLLPSPFALISTLHPYLISISLPTTPILLNYFPNLQKYIKIQHECIILTSTNMGFSSTKTPCSSPQSTFVASNARRRLAISNLKIYTWVSPSLFELSTTQRIFPNLYSCHSASYPFSPICTLYY